MTDHSDDQPDARVYNFPQIGFRLAPTTTLTDPPTAGADVPPRPDFPPTTPSPAGPGRRVRRSPLDALNALPDPGLTAPLLPVPAASPAPAAGHVTDTFHGDDDQDGYAGARLGALSLAACLAVAVAALRGTHTFLTDRRQRRLATEAENAKIREARLKMRLAADEARSKHVLAMQGLQSKQAQQRAKQRVQSGPEFGRKSLGRSGSGSGGSGKSSGGRGGGAGRGGGSSAGPKKPKTGGGLFGGGNGSSKKNSNRRGPNSGSGSGGGLKQKKPGNILEPKKSPRRNSQGGSKTAQDKQRRKQTGGGKGNGAGSGRGLGAALKKDTQKAAARRWKKRQKRGPNNPALWGNSPKNQKNAPKKGPGPAGKNTPNTPNAKNRKARKVQAQGAGANRRKLNQALWHNWKKAAGRRWKKRTTGPVPPIWKTGGHRKNKTGPQQAAPGGPAGANTAPKAPKPNLKKNKQGGQQHAGRWARAQAWARKKAAKGDFFGGTGPDPQQANPRQAAHDPGQAPGAAGSGANAGQPGHDGQAGTPGGNRRRRSPFENAGQAAGQAAGGAYTVERDDYVGAQAKQWEPDAIGTGQAALPATGPAALDAAPTTNPPRPGTTRPRKPIPMPQASRDTQAVIAQAHKDAARTANHLTQGRQMDAQHATEITLDDAIDEYGDFKDDAFKTHDQCHKLAARAIKLREVLLAFADDLAVNHNLIGPLFSGAMARMAESMDLVARMAEEMQTSSLQAAEMAETADNDLNDAYRPYNVATADAGLTTPSAPIHNQA